MTEYTQVEPTRHMELFNPYEFTTPVTVIGAGASGSWLVLQLAKLGITNITVWDFDKIESHNIANQLFGIHQVGQSKVEALHNIIFEQTGTRIKVKNEKYVGAPLAGYVFCMIDTMAGRKEIWNNNIKFKPNVKLYIEPRMGMDVGRVYNMKPMELHTHAPYEATLYSDDVAEVSACGASMSVVTTAVVLAGWCVRQLINDNNDSPLANEILIDLMYNNVFQHTWERD